MVIWKKFIHSNFIIKLKSWEYWPFGILQFPLFFYFAWLSLRSRSLIFFSASNPGIPMGGMFGESKIEILKKIPQQYIARAVLVNMKSSVDEVMEVLAENNFHLPVIFKPDLGERGFMVKRIMHRQDIESYLKNVKINFIAQELVDFPMEFGIFYTRFPLQVSGRVTSVVMKEMLTVTGDGLSSLQALILAKDRAKLQWNILRDAHREKLSQVLPKGKVFELVSIGNHCLGTKFLDSSHLINDKLSEVFDNISKQIDGFYFGRFDLRCQSLEDLYNGRIKILELNGCGAEPAHIYQPGYSIISAIKVLFIHWRNIFLIARQNRKLGIKYTTIKEAWSYYKAFKKATA